MNKNTNSKTEIVDWLCNNRSLALAILNDMENAKKKLLEMEPIVFHDDIVEEFYDLGIKKIADQITKDLAIPIEMVYNIIEDKRLLINTLNTNLN